ncbi:hypothetical protein [Pseudomonas sp. LB1P83]
MAALESPTLVGEWCSSKAIFYWRYVGKVLFLKRFFPKVGNPVSSGSKKGIFLQHLTTFTEDGAGGIPVISLTSRGMSALLSSGFQPGSYGKPPAWPLFFCCALFLRAASFSDVGMFPWQ